METILAKFGGSAPAKERGGIESIRKQLVELRDDRQALILQMCGNNAEEAEFIRRGTVQGFLQKFEGWVNEQIRLRKK